MGGESLHVSIPTLWPLSSTQGVYKTDEASGRLPETERLSSHNISRRYANTTPGQRPTTTSGPTGLPIIRELGVDGESEEICINTHPGVRVSGFPSVLHVNEAHNTLRETQKNPAGCQAHAGTTIRVIEGGSKICGQDYCYHESYSISSIALQGPPVIDELCPSFELHTDTGGDMHQIRNKSATDSSQQGRLGMVGSPRESSPWSTSVSSGPDTNSALRCFQQGLGSSAKCSITDGRPMVSRRGNSPHKLSRVASSLSGNQSIREDMAEHHSPTVNGQYYGSDLYQSERGHSLTTTVSTSTDNLDLVCREEYNPSSRASTRSAELAGRCGIEDNERSLRLDAEPVCIPANKHSDGSTGDRSVCITPDQTASTFLQLEARPGGRGDRCLYAKLGSLPRVCQPSMVSDTPLPVQAEETSSTNGTDNTIVENSAMVPASSGTCGGFSPVDTSSTRSGGNATGTRVPDATRGTSTGRPAYLRQSYSSRGFSSQASDLMLASWRDKTNSNYGSSFSKWSSWCQQRGRDPLSGPIEDVVNFLAALYSEGYQYQSLNAYRSAISSTHEKVDGISVGSHPAVSRLLKRVFHSRPPQPRYASFWDVGMVIQHIRSLGPNKDLSLKQLTMKTVMLLALTRPSRSADLSKLDVHMCSFKSNGVVFRPVHLTKQSRSSRPMADFFFPSSQKIRWFVPW